MTTDSPDAAPAEPEEKPTRKRRGLRILWWVLGIIGGLLLAAIVGIVIILAILGGLFYVFRTYGRR